MGQSEEARRIQRKGLRVKNYIITIEQIDESPEGDILPFASEEHQLILSGDEKLIGICFVYQGSDPLTVELPS